MKYIKLYEITGNIYIGDAHYWKIRTKSLAYILVSLKKIGLTPDDQIFSDVYDSFVKENFNEIYYGYFYIGRGTTSLGDYYWYWSYNISSFKGKHSNLLDHNKFKFEGEVKVEDWELNVDKYNL